MPKIDHSTHYFSPNLGNYFVLYFMLIRKLLFSLVFVASVGWSVLVRFIRLKNSQEGRRRDFPAQKKNPFPLVSIRWRSRSMRTGEAGHSSHTADWAGGNFLPLLFSVKHDIYGTGRQLIATKFQFLERGLNPAMRLTINRQQRVPLL